MKILLTILTLILFPHAVFAISTRDLHAIQYDTVFFDETDSSSSCGTTGTTILSGSDSAQKTYSFLITKGLTPIQAVGVMGNLAVESGINPRRVQSTPTPGGDKDNITVDGLTGFGIAQWTYITRQQALADFANKAGKISGDLAVQLDFLYNESSTGSRAGAFDKQKQYTDVRAASYGWEDNYENPSTSHQELRVQMANGFLVTYGSGAANISTSSPSSSTPNTTVSTCGGTLVNTDIGNYQNPFRDVHNIAGAGVDAGVDYSGDGPVYAIGNGTVVTADPNSSWVGGNSVVYKLKDGGAAGKLIYVTENCTVSSALKVGQAVTANTVLCTMHNSYPFIETGWTAEAPGRVNPLAYADNCYYNAPGATLTTKTSTAYGANLNDLMKKLGAPNSDLLAPPITCTLPTGWPAW